MGLTSYGRHGADDLRSALSHYQESLRRNPIESRTWLAAARAYRDMGMAKDAAFALTRTVDLEKNNPLIIWEAGVFFLTENNLASASELFRRYLTMVPAEQENVYALYHMMGVDVSHILDGLLPRDVKFYSRYLTFLISNRLLTEGIETWAKLKALSPGKEDYLKFCDFLIAEGELVQAEGLWNDLTKRFKIVPVEPDSPGDSLIWNGGFELEILDGGFDWKVGRAEGMRVFKDRDIRKTGDVSLSVNFDGKQNPDVRVLRQVVPVEPGVPYRVAAFIKTDNITTTNGIFLEVTGHRCGPFLKKSDSLGGTNLWTRVMLDFTAPGACKAVTVAVRRERSPKFDNKISGDAWIDSLSMTKL